jgi:hypothetical protein
MNTHRALSRNAASSRAIPASHIIEQVRQDAYVPNDLPDGPLCGNRPGMVATEPMDEVCKTVGLGRICDHAEAAIATVEYLAARGWHKQDANRYLEPFQWVRWVGTATNWDNFFALRTDHRAYPPFRFLARAMWVAYTRSVPEKRGYHLPFVTDADWNCPMAELSDPPPWFPKGVGFPCGGSRVTFNLMAWSAARCARVSVKNFRTDDTDRKKDMETFLKLTTEFPRHGSPAEHQAVAIFDAESSNFRHPWKQFRKFIPQETVEAFSPPAETVAGWNVPDAVFGGVPGVDW